MVELRGIEPLSGPSLGCADRCSRSCYGRQRSTGPLAPQNAILVLSQLSYNPTVDWMMVAEGGLEPPTFRV